MPTYKTSGIVIRRHNLGEADRIITFMTVDYGKVRAVARGVRKIKSRLAGHVELFCRSDLMLAQGRNLDVLTSARLQFHPALTEDYTGLQAAYLFAEMTDRLTEEGQAHPEVFSALAAGLEQLAAGEAGQLAELNFKLRLLDALGYRPQLNGCGNCGYKGGDRDYYFNSDGGGLTCAACPHGGQAGLSQAAIKLWRLILRSGANLGQIKGSQEAAEASLPVLDGFLEFLFGRRFASRDILTAGR